MGHMATNYLPPACVSRLIFNHSPHTLCGQFALLCPVFQKKVNYKAECQVRETSGG